MDNDGGLHYEAKSEQDKPGVLDSMLKSGTLESVKELLDQPKNYEEASDQKWNQYKDDVLKVVKKGILSNVPKPKKIIKPPTPEPEIEHLKHLEVRTVEQLIDSFDEDQ